MWRMVQICRSWFVLTFVEHKHLTVEELAKKETATLWTLQLLLFEMTQNGRFKWFQAGAVEAKDGWPKCPSAAQKSVWLSTSAIDCICKPALGVLKKKTLRKTKKGAEQCVSKYRTQRAIPPLSCLFYSKCHSVSESTFEALRQRCRCSALNIYRHGQMGVGFTRAPAGVQITQQPLPADWKLLKTITDPDRGAHQAVMLLLKKAAQNRFLWRH